MMIWIVCVTLVVVLVLWYLRWRQVPVSTADGAVVMALGILISGAMQRIDFLRDKAGPYLATGLLAILVCLIAGVVRDAWQGTFRERHLHHPIASFATGTWVAAISVTSVVIVKILPELRMMAVVLFVSNLFLWSAYLLLVARNYWVILRQRDLLAQTHGVLLLACVTTQSIVVAGQSAMGSLFPAAVSRVLIVLGLLLYLLGAVLVVLRYLRSRPWNLADNWANTNCILHGALSITGLACAVSHVLPTDLCAVLWVCVFVLFLVVEGLEACRLVRRVKIYGWNQGVFTYANSQWARNFTFGMWLAFTMNLSFEGSFVAHRVFWNAAREAVLYGGPFVIVGLFVVEGAIFIKKVYFDRRSSIRKSQDSISA